MLKKLNCKEFIKVNCHMKRITISNNLSNSENNQSKMRISSKLSQINFQVLSRLILQIYWRTLLWQALFRLRNETYSQHVHVTLSWIWRKHFTRNILIKISIPFVERLLCWHMHCTKTEVFHQGFLQQIHIYWKNPQWITSFFCEVIPSLTPRFDRNWCLIAIDKKFQLNWIWPI